MAQCRRYERGRPARLSGAVRASHWDRAESDATCWSCRRRAARAAAGGLPTCQDLDHDSACGALPWSRSASFGAPGKPRRRSHWRHRGIRHCRDRYGVDGRGTARCAHVGHVHGGARPRLDTDSAESQHSSDCADCAACTECAAPCRALSIPRAGGRRSARRSTRTNRPAGFSRVRHEVGGDPARRRAGGR
jgi:hypothetical protein